MSKLQNVVIAGIGIALIGLAGCGAAETEPTLAGGFNNAACSSGSCQTVQMVFPNPQFDPSLGGGGGIVGDPVTVKLPNNRSSFHLHVDGSVGLLTWNDETGVDSALYSLRLASVIAVTTDFTVHTMSGTTGSYAVPAGSSVDLYPVWQSVVDTPEDRVLPAGQVGVLVEMFY